MKLGKGEIQKIVLGVLMLFGVVFSYFSLLLGPLMQRQAMTRQSITALGPEIANAKAQIEKTRELEKTEATATLTAMQVEAMIPEGSPVAWFPTRMAEFFKKQGLEKTATRLNGETADKELAGFRKLGWGIDLPKVEFVTFAKALAALENEEPLLEISSVQIDANREDVETQRALLTLNNLIKQ